MGRPPPGIELAATVTDYIHLLAAAFWVGVLFGLALILPVVFSHSPDGNVRRVILAVLPRFSLVVGLSVVALIVTGLYSAWAQVTVLPALVVPYGLTLIAKTALVGVLLIFGATNLLWLTPAIRANRRAASLLRRTVTAEAIIGVLVILATAYLTRSRTGPAGRVPGGHRYSAKSDLPGHSGGDHHRRRNRAGTIRSEHGDRYACRPSRRSDCECLGSGHTPVLPRR